METQEQIKEPQTSCEKKEANEVSARSAPEQITTTVKQTVPKNSGRIAAGKKLAEHNKKACEAKKKAKEVTRSATQEQKENPPSTENESEQSSSFHSLKCFLLPALLLHLQDYITRGKN